MSDCRERLLKDIEVVTAEMAGREMGAAITERILKILVNYEIMERCTDLAPVESRNEKILKRYCACLRIDGKSERTIYQYARMCKRLDDFLQKPFTEIGTYDIRFFLGCEKERGISGRSLENTRAILSAFFQWMTNEEMIPRNPMAKIKPIKCADVTRLPFSDTDIDALRGACKTTKERTIVEILLSSGIRVSELSQMDITDIDLRNMMVHVIHGKGDKERMTFITPVAAKYVEGYLSGRKDSLPALIVNQKRERMTPGGIRHILKEIEKRSGVNNVHPHRFRRTFASGLAARGMSVQEIKQLLGHSNIDTTMEYVFTSDTKVQASYRQYIA